MVGTMIEIAVMISRLILAVYCMAGIAVVIWATWAYADGRGGYDGHQN